MIAYIPEKSVDAFRRLFPVLAMKMYKWQAKSDGTVNIYVDHDIYHFLYNCKTGHWTLTGTDKIHKTIYIEKGETDGRTEPDQLG